MATPPDSAIIDCELVARDERANRTFGLRVARNPLAKTRSPRTAPLQIARKLVGCKERPDGKFVPMVNLRDLRLIRNRVEKQAFDFDQRRFAKLCAMLASPNAGERATAALKATELLAGLGLTWKDVVSDHPTLLERLGRNSSDDGQDRVQRFWRASSGADDTH